MAKKKKNEKKKSSFSKTLLIQESILIWIITLAFLVLAFYSVFSGYSGELPFLSTMVGLPWAAYGVSAAYYYKKSMKENTKDGIIFEQALREEQVDDTIEQEDIVG